MVSSSTVLWSWVQRGRGRRNPRTQPNPRCHHMIEFHILHVFVTSRAEGGHVYVCSRSWWQRYRSCTKTPRTYNCLCAKAVTLSERLDFSDHLWDLLAWLLVVLYETLAGGHNTAVQSRLFHLWCLICPVVDGLLIEAPPQDQGRWRDLEQYFLSWGLSAKNTFTTYSVWWEQCSCTCNSSGPLPQPPNLPRSSHRFREFIVRMYNRLPLLVNKCKDQQRKKRQHIICAYLAWPLEMTVIRALR